MHTPTSTDIHHPRSGHLAGSSHQYLSRPDNAALFYYQDRFMIVRKYRMLMHVRCYLYIDYRCLIEVIEVLRTGGVVHG